MYRRVVSLAGVPALLSASSDIHARALDQMFGALPPARARPRARIDLRPGRIDLPTRPPDESLGDIQCWHEPDGVTVEHETGMTAQVTGTAANIRGDGPDIDLVLRWVCQPVLGYLLSPFGCFLLHAGAVSRGGLALLLLGPSGSGKSTATYAALRAGWEVLGDDHVVIRRNGGTLQVTGIPKPLSVPAEVATDLSAGARRMYDQRDRWEIPSGVIASGWREAAGAVAVRHAGSLRGEIGEADRLRLLRELIAAFPASGSRGPLAQFMPVAAALTRASHSELWLGLDPAQRVDGAAELLDRIMARGARPMAAGR